MKKLLASVSLVAALSAPSFGPAFAQDETSGDTVLATVNGNEITVGHLIAMRQMLPPEYQQLPDEVLFDGMLEQLIQQQVLADEAEGNVTRSMELGLENERRAFLAAMYMDDVAMADLDEAELQAAYDETYGAVEPTIEYNAAHILLEGQEDAENMLTELEAGADFAELAAEHSIGPSGPNGGALGWFTEGMMVPEFEAAVMALEAGEVSSPVQTQFGWHVVLLNETREQAAPALEDVRAELEESIRRARVDARLAELTAEAEIERAEVEIDPAMIRDLDLIAQ
ncbi:peptidylprolyl isomerase [Rhodobacteraceae bacterium N5(2021)]|uniref:Parvulin-like PPIase n=1 Tax=Gymnodinialimonas phycosphaerae TaxID=2841589 RepID=A0A975TSV8_9RHOB|nr:peptidylprolyl isomerase [Gymnodinialimonas phycosphaerae]MBY4894345.1 peptidylprolyl isomerase [Gymnodinialimonas phycosphaerae]